MEFFQEQLESAGYEIPAAPEQAWRLRIEISRVNKA
jgi:hypothetical protein